MNTTKIVIDNGTENIRAGFGGTEKPLLYIPPVVAVDSRADANAKCAYVGKEAQTTVNKQDKNGSLALNTVIKRGMITDFDHMHQIWDYTFQKLKATPKGADILLSYNALTPKQHRQTMAEIMFESFEANRVYIGIPAYLALFGSGATEGVVVCSGAGVTNVVPVEQAMVFPNAIFRIPIAGNDLTQYMYKLFDNTKLKVTPLREIYSKRIKLKMCYVASDFDEELKKWKENPKKFEEVMDLDSGTIKISNEKFRLPECMFEPCLLGVEGPGLVQSIYDSIQLFDMSSRGRLYNNIVLAGDNMLFKGMAERVRDELGRMTSHHSSKLSINVTPARKDMEWTGGSILSVLPTFDPMWITKKDFEEVGPSIVAQKCF